jgi:PIN domain nuclease of toxin-antitoxin system
MGQVLLLDTHALIWAAKAPERLGRGARRAIENGENKVFVSAVSAMEIATKYRLGKLPEGEELAKDFVRQVEGHGLVELPLLAAHGQLGGNLPIRHADPFDRMLIAQALIEQMTLVSNENLFDSFGVIRLW